MTSLSFEQREHLRMERSRARLAELQLDRARTGGRGCCPQCGIKYGTYTSDCPECEARKQRSALRNPKAAA